MEGSSAKCPPSWQNLLQDQENVDPNVMDFDAMQISPLTGAAHLLATYQLHILGSSPVLAVLKRYNANCSIDDLLQGTQTVRLAKCLSDVL